MGNARNVIKKRTRCFICEKWMEVGTPFIFLALRSRGVDRWLPAHPEHQEGQRSAKEQLDKARKEAARNGHGVEEDYGDTRSAYTDPSDFYVI